MPGMTDPAADEARQLLPANTDRAVTGRLDDPALFAAVVGVERLVVATGATDAEVLRAAFEGRLPQRGHGLFVAAVRPRAGKRQVHRQRSIDDRQQPVERLIRAELVHALRLPIVDCQAVRNVCP